MEFRVLGSVEIRADGKLADPGHARQRSVLAILLLELGRIVSPDELIDRIWGEKPPNSARNVLYSYVARLRAVLGGLGDPDVTLARRPGGYLLQARPEQLDVSRFRCLVAEAAPLSNDDERRALLLTEALRLWQGPALAGLASPWLAVMRERLELERVAVVLERNDIVLRQGKHGTLISELAGEVAASPTDERLLAQLMLALYRTGQQATALRKFEQTRVRLADELGADPGPQLRALHEQILRADPSLLLVGGA